MKNETHIYDIGVYLAQGVKDGLFNEIWYYISELLNYSLVFSIQVFNDDDFEYHEHIGTLNSKGFLDINNNLINLTPREGVPNDGYIHGSKYIWNYEGDSEKNKTGFRTGSKFVSEINSNPAYLTNHNYQTTLSLELLYKIEECIIILLSKSEELNKFFSSLAPLLSAPPHFVGFFNLISVLHIKDKQTIPNPFFCIDQELITEVDIKPFNSSIITEVQNILNNPVTISAQLKIENDNLLLELQKAEQLETETTQKDVLCGRYHRVIEIIANSLYKNYYQIIIDHYKDDKYDVKLMEEIKKKKENLKLTSLNKVLDFFFALKDCDLPKNKKTFIGKVIIPHLLPLRGLSKIRHGEVHGSMLYSGEMLTYTIGAYKLIIKLLLKFICK